MVSTSQQDLEDTRQGVEDYQGRPEVRHGLDEFHNLLSGPPPRVSFHVQHNFLAYKAGDAGTGQREGGRAGRGGRWPRKAPV